MSRVIYSNGYGFHDRSNTLRLSNYILLSVCFHLIFFGILGSGYLHSQDAEMVFDVNIVEIEPLTPPVMKRAKPVLKKKQFLKHRRRPLAKKPPNTIRDVSPVSGLMAQKNDRGVLGEKGLEAAEPGKEIAVPSLFDREIIEKYASRIPDPEKGITFDASEFKNRGYMRSLRDKIENIWKYPKEASRRGMSGDLHLMFSIKRNGELGDVEILRTSGHRSLDRAAIQALKDAAPFWPLPDDWPEEQLEIKGHFIYLYGRTHIM